MVQILVMIRFLVLIIFMSILSFGCKTKVIEHVENNEPLFKVEKIEYKGIPFSICTMNPDTVNLKMSSYMENGILRIKELDDSLQKEKKQLLFATNGGIFSKEYIPGGFFANNDTLLHALNEREGAGNFHLLPNGIFYLRNNRKAGVAETQEFKDLDLKDIHLGVQSGPMLVINDEIHPAFRDGSENVHIRNGVGVDNNGNIVFVISKKKTNLFTFASLYKERLQCKNALYLDGFISEMYLKDLSKEHEINRRFATIFYLEDDLILK
ncbi:MAG: hypothetical protein ACI94Y_000097 [Maribacter sp.]